MNIIPSLGLLFPFYHFYLYSLRLKLLFTFIFSSSQFSLFTFIFSSSQFLLFTFIFSLSQIPSAVNIIPSLGLLFLRLRPVERCSAAHWQFKRTPKCNILRIYKHNFYFHQNRDGVPIIFGNDLSGSNLQYSNGFMKFGCPESSKIMFAF